VTYPAAVTGTGLRLGGRSAVGAVAILLMLVPFLATPADAGAELAERGDLFVRFSGGIAPSALPRHWRAPIAVNIDGTVKTLSGERPPALRRIVIAINRGGRLDTRGLPVCSKRQIAASSSTQALRACGPALVGRGTYTAAVAFPEQETFISRGRIFAFNAIVDGGRGILAHVYGSKPASITRIIVFRIHRDAGTFGTVFVGAVPESVNHYGYVKRIRLNLFRLFSHRGEVHSYLSAACAAPPGFPGAVFPFARTGMAFADGRTLSSILSRSCQVRR
jgi:hypothetical protein